MFYRLSKVLDLFASPLCVSLLCALAAAYFARRGQARRAWSFAGAAFLLSYLFATPLVSDNLTAYAERHDGRPFRPGQEYDAVIVLGGFVSVGNDGQFALSESGDRALRAYELLRDGHARMVVIAAGGPLPELSVEADAAAALFERWGIARDRMLLGRTSVNTRQNALEAKSFVRAKKFKRLVLVTSATHMQRALECMRAVGLEPDVLPCDQHGAVRVNPLLLLRPLARSLALSELVLRELLGRVIYRAVGYAKTRA